VYQNGNTNTALAPNENYARELQELFTVGKGPDSHYTEDDVRAAARGLTGWADNFTSHESTNISSSFIPAEHDTGDKQFSAFYNNIVIKGRTGDAGAQELDELVDMIFGTKETARMLCRKLYRFFVYYNITETVEQNVIAPLADLLIANNFEIAAPVRTLLSSEHFYDERNTGCLIKNPADLLVGMARQFNMELPALENYTPYYNTLSEFNGLMEGIDMNIGDPPSVAGWPAYYQLPQYHELWINSDTLTQRNVITDMLLGTGYNENGVQLKLDCLKFTAALTEPDNADKLIAESVKLLSPLPFDALQHNHVKTQFLLSGQTDDYYWTEAWKAYTAKPDDPVARNQVENRLQKYYMYLLSRAECQMI